MGYQHRYTSDVTLAPRFIYHSHFFTAGFYIGIYIPAGHKTLVQKNARHYRHSDHAVNLSSMPDYPMHYDMIFHRRDSLYKTSNIFPHSQIWRVHAHLWTAQEYTHKIYIGAVAEAKKSKYFLRAGNKNTEREHIGVIWRGESEFLIGICISPVVAEIFAKYYNKMLLKPFSFHKPLLCWAMAQGGGPDKRVVLTVIFVIQVLGMCIFPGLRNILIKFV